MRLRPHGACAYTHIGVRITSIPSQIAFQLSLFPDNIPRPQPKTSAKLIGGLLHFTHFCVRVSRIRAVPDSDLGWEDMYREGEGDPWFDWVRIRATENLCVLMLPERPYLQA